MLLQNLKIFGINFVCSNIFGMAAMQFPCNGILLIQGNLPKIFPMASFPIPYFKLFNFVNNHQVVYVCFF